MGGGKMEGDKERKKQRRGDGGEKVGVEHMVVRGYRTGVEVKNVADGDRMRGRIGHEATTTGTGLPLGELLTIPQGRVKHIHWAPHG